jgi:electron transfer flavoprotein beta subunit
MIFMRIIVCVRGVLNVNTSLKIDFNTNTLDLRTNSYIPNPYDLAAIEAAIRVRERFEEGKVTLLTLGPPTAEDMLMKYLALGAQEGVRVWDKEIAELDSSVTSLLLALASKKLGYDLILCGRESLDTHTAQVGPRIAELLDLPHVAAIAKLSISSDKKGAIVERKLEKGDREVVRCSLPALFTVDTALNPPRYPTYPQHRKAWKMEIIRWSVSDLGLEEPLEPRVKILGLSPPRPRPKKIFTPDSNLPAMERMKLLMSGGITTKKSSETVEESPESAASKVIDFLHNEEILSNSQ